MAGGMKVSVLVVSYNHERFIAEAIDSVLMQRTDFDYEIVVGDDCSSDRTREILSQLQAEHRDKIRLLFHEKRLGSRGNFNRILEACRGEYIACLDGDDYWLVSDKLQKQVDFLDAHPACPLCCHNAIFVYESAALEPTPVFDDLMGTFLGVDDVLLKSPAVTTTTMLRGNVALDLRDIPLVLLGDKTRAVAAAYRYGPIGYIGEIMSAWRVHGGGVLNSKWQLPATQRRIKSHQTQIEFFEAIDRFLGYEHHELVSKQVAERCYALASTQLRNGDLSSAFASFRKGWCYATLPSGNHTLATVGVSFGRLVSIGLKKFAKLFKSENKVGNWKMRWHVDAEQ